MKIVFIGAVDFSFHCLEKVLENNGQVEGIVTLKKSIYHSDFKDLTPISKKYKIPIHYCKNINHIETIDWIKSKSPDIIFCFGFSQLLKKKVLSIPRMGVIGSHPALLPQNRGHHPLIWALALGIEECGLTFFFMDTKIDSGKILSQRKISIDGGDTAQTLYEKIKKLASLQISEFLSQLLSGKYKLIQQNHDIANTWRKRCKNDGIIDWRMSGEAILNLIRALSTPYPAASFNYKNQEIKVWKAKKYDQLIPKNIEHGKIVKIIEQKPVIKCYDGAIQLLEYEPIINFISGEYII